MEHQSQFVLQIPVVKRFTFFTIWGTAPLWKIFILIQVQGLF